jgi:beta-glucosidase
MEMIDRSVRRILRQKLALGLFEHPLVDPDRAVRVVHSAENQDLALQAARESIVLLKNEGNLLPLRKTLNSIAVIGPNADDGKNLLGDYVSKTIPQKLVTVLDGIKAQVSPHTKVLYARGSEIFGQDRSGFDEALRIAKSSDIAVVVVGELERRSSKGCSDGEGCDAATLELTGAQEDLVRAVHATGRPTVVVLVNGRPLATAWIADHVPALVEAWLPGEKGGTAVAEVLFGGVNPSGRLAITVPRHVGQFPFYYNFKPTRGRWVNGKLQHRKYVDMSGAPLYPFGFGLSYTQFDYANLRISPSAIGPFGRVEVTADLRNAGAREGAEVVQLYIDDVVSSVTRPIQELKGFDKVSLKPGETRTVRFSLGFDELSMLNRNMERVVEPGTFRVMVGSSAEDLKLQGSFDVRP